MKRILHICWGLEPTNGAAVVARMIASDQRRHGAKAELKTRLGIREIKTADEVWCHCGWYYGIWWAIFWAKAFGRRVCWLPAGSYDPIRLAYHGWKKRLAGPFERWALRQCDEVVATCAAEADWIRAYEPRVKKTAVTDVRRFFRTSEKVKVKSEEGRNDRSLRVLYLGREHPLKGTEHLKRAVDELGGCAELKMASTAQGEEKEALWRWADVLVLPTLSDNFGLVVAEALEHGVPVVTTDGAPAWLDLEWPLGICLKGYRDGTDAERIRLLREALSGMAGR